MARRGVRGPATRLARRGRVRGRQVGARVRRGGPGAGRVCAAAELLVDAYHALDVVPFSLQRDRLLEACVVGGGYKYCQLGEGNGFLRIPAGCTLRPVITGWFSEFESLATGDPSGPVTYGPGAARFAGEIGRA